MYVVAFLQQLQPGGGNHISILPAPEGIMNQGPWDYFDPAGNAIQSYSCILIMTVLWCREINVHHFTTLLKQRGCS